MPSILSTPQSANANSVVLPFKFTPREYQTTDLFRPLFPHHFPDLKLLDTPRKKRICLVWHRRAGKDKGVVNALTLAAWEEVGNYLYLLPEQTQAKKIVWRGIDKDGVRFIDHIPPQIIKRKYESEMLIELVNGSTIQIGGADNYDSWMGTNPKGIVLSEYSIQDPMAWQYFRPILVENEGWAVFIYTARGKNHGYDLYKVARANPETWHASLKTIEDTRKQDGSPVITVEDYNAEIAQGMHPSLARQEFYCDFEAALVGSYYGDLIAKARAEQSIGHHPYDPALPVFTAWDLGNDANVVVFAQSINGHPRIIDHYEEQNTPFTEVCKEVCAKPYSYAAHFAPHDVKNRDHETNTRLNTATSFGIDFVVTPRGSRNDGIEAVRQLIPRTQFHEEKVERLIDALSSYSRVFDEKLKTFKEQPVHDWASHGCFLPGTLITTKRGDVPIEDIVAGDFVWTPNGYSLVEKRIDKTADTITEVEMSDGKRILVTPNHKVFTKRGLVSVDALRYADYILTGKELSCKIVSFISRALNMGYRETITRDGATAARASAIFTEQCGPTDTARSPRDTTFTTETLIPSTISSTISNASRRGSTAECTSPETAPEGGSNPPQMPAGRRQKNGMLQKRGPSGTPSTGRRRGRIVSGLCVFVRNAAKNLCRLILLAPSIATPTVSRMRVVEGEGGQLVHDLTVRKNACYLANGLLVSNSDAFRILAVNWTDSMVDSGWMTKDYDVDASWVV